MEAYSEPADGDYTVLRDYPLGGEIPLLDAREVACTPVAECFPRGVVESSR